MRLAIIRITGIFCVFMLPKSQAEPISWINAEQAALAQVEWGLDGDYYIVDVFVNGGSPFTCSSMVTYDTAIGLGEGGQCDIRSPRLDGLIEIEVKSFFNTDDLHPAEKILLTRKKDTLAPEIHFNNDQLEVTDLNLDEKSIKCTLNGIEQEGCKFTSPVQGTLTITASDFAGNQSTFTYTRPGSH